jgi:type IV pilus assembly protein PilE
MKAADMSFKASRARRNQMATDLRMERQRPSHGFTLIELVIAMVVIAVLAAIAIPNYSAYVTRSKRAAAKTVLLDAASVLERNYTTNGCYNKTAISNCQSGSGSTAPTIPSGAPTDGRASYAIKADGNFGSTLASQTFTLVAVPCGVSGAGCGAGSDAFTDAECGNQTLTNTGARGVSTSTDAAVIARCWQR